MKYFPNLKYINDCKTYNMHNKMNNLYDTMSNDLSKQNNLIFYVIHLKEIYT